MPLEDVPRIHPASAAEWRAWLAEHHATATGVWPVSWRSGSARTPLAYEDQVLEALAYGWCEPGRPGDPRRPSTPARRTLIARADAAGSTPSSLSMSDNTDGAPPAAAWREAPDFGGIR
jgi:hypothetical protein